MGLQELERLLSSFWEGIFLKSPRQIQPVEIARALVREMSQQRRVSVSRIYAPNVFTIALSSDDFDKTAPLHAALSEELEEYIRQKAAEKGFTLIGKPSVTFEEDAALGVGEIRVRSRYAATGNLLENTAEQRNSYEKGHCLFNRDHTMIFKKDEKSVKNEASLQERVMLKVVEGPDRGKKFLLEGKGPFTIGRQSTNHVVLTDINTSREHALLEYCGDELYLVDLNSKNGTFVNGSVIERKRVEPGDKIQIGENLLEIERG
ncbi:MAG: FhaA domain-containing protein [Thermacetogeniaceae bacterium]